MKKPNNKKYNVEIAQKVLELHNKKEAHKSSEAEYKKSVDRLTIDIKNFMFVHGIDFLSFGLSELSESGKNQKMICKKITPVSISFDAEKIEKKLDKQLTSKFIQKEIVIDDWNGFVKYMKELGASLEEIKKYVSSKKTVDKKALDNAEKLGQISMEDLKGCYTAKKGTSYLSTKISEEDE